MKNSKETIPDYLVDSCKCSSVNQMAAGSRLPRSSHRIFSPFYQVFKHTLAKCNIRTGCRTPTDVKAINKINTWIVKLLHELKI